MQKLQSLSLIIPVYNEEKRLHEFLSAIDNARFGLKKELVLVNDGSTDSSAAIIRSFKFKSRCICIDLPANWGKGAALQQGIQAATGDIIGIQDADFEYEIADIARILKEFTANNCDVVYGSRFSKLNPQVRRTFHYLANRLLTFLSNFFSGLYVSDMETCYKFFRREIIQNIQLKSRRFGFEPEVTAKIAHLDLRIKEIPISYFPRNTAEGKKINWKDGVAALWHLFFYNFIARKSEFFKKTMPQKYLAAR